MRTWRMMTTSGRAVWRHACVLSLLAAAPLGAQSSVAPRPMPDSVRNYITTAVTRYRDLSVHRATTNWDSLLGSVLQVTASAQTPSETWAALSAAFHGVDRHSFLMPPPSSSPASDRPNTPVRPPAEPQLLGRLVQQRLGVVVVPSHGGPNRPSYVDSLHAQLQSLDSSGVCGWIVDLRRNTGGNMWPMLAGIGPLLGAEDVGSFTAGGPGLLWHYRDGRAWYGGSATPTNAAGRGSAAAGPALRHAAAPIALLLGRQTASSGEMTAIAFFGRADLRSFGDSTGGYASANATVALRDGAQLLVTSSYPRDRLGRSYTLTLAPDELIAPSKPGEDDATVRAASTWLLRQATCRAEARR
ncbi:MAG: S41 family peptidase [Gemmatimonadales bacterium]